MKSLTTRLILTVMLVFSLSSVVFAGTSQSINVTANVPLVTDGMSVSISKVQGTTWTKNQTTMDFGTLTYNTTYNIFMPTYYFAVDVGVTDNSGTIWQLTHTRNSIQKDAANNLDGNVNVTFVQQTPDPNNASTLQYISYASSNNVSYTKTQIGTGNWLRIYYGIGTGDPLKPDATGVTPIGADKPAGTYTGSVTITLTP